MDLEMLPQLRFKTHPHPTLGVQTLDIDHGGALQLCGNREAHLKACIFRIFEFERVDRDWEGFSARGRVSCDNASRSKGGYTRAWARREHDSDLTIRMIGVDGDGRGS